MWPFKRKSVIEEDAGFDVLLKTEPTPPDFEKLDADWQLDSSISPRRLSALYLEHAWALQNGDHYGIPLPAGLVRFMATNTREVVEDEDIMYRETGRLLFLKDDINEEVVHVYLHVATASKPIPEEVSTDDE